MFKNLRNQFIITIMLIISVILVMSFAAIYVSAANSLGRRLDLPSASIVGDGIGSGVVDFFQKQREEYASRAMNELLITLIISGASTMVAVYFVSRYIADRAISPIEEAYEKQRQFVADASHELKTPITIIGANVDAAMADSKKPSKWLENIRSEVDHSGRLVSDLLTLAKFDIEQAPVVRRRFDIAEMCHDLAEQFTILSTDKDLTLTKECEKPLQVVGDEERLRQIMTVLLDNAIKHTEKGGKIWLSAQRRREEVVLMVENTHEDIPASQLSHLFERFYQGDQSHAGKGTGLGLAIARKIARHMKWTIDVASSGGKVSFTVVVPR